MNFVKASASALLARAGYEQFGVFAGWARKSGWFRSVTSKKPIDGRGKPLPWYSYPAIHFLDSRVTDALKSRLRVFEFGSGNSTLWWAGRASDVVSIEDDPHWHAYVRSAMPPNVTYRLAADKSEYVESLRAQGRAFDVIVVDGSHREDCARAAVDSLSEDGVVIFDNSDLAQHASALELLRTSGFRQLEFYGLGPMNGHPWGTSIFYRERNLFAI